MEVVSWERIQEYYNIYICPHDEDMPGLLKFLAGAIVTLASIIVGFITAFPPLKMDIDKILVLAYLLLCVSTFLYLRRVKKPHPPFRYFMPDGDGSR